MKNNIESANVLSIVIPTYNRANILRDNLNYILEDIIRFDISVYISDDSSNDETKNMINDLRKNYSKIYYFRNIPALGHDKNCIRTLKIPNSQYIWYLGDSMIIKKGSILKILSVINDESPDFISFKEEKRNIDIPTGVINKSKILFDDFAWHLTMSGATVYKKESLQFRNFDISTYKNFPQLALIFHSFQDGISNFFWLNESLILGNVNKISYWNENVFEVFFKDLKSTLSNFPQRYHKISIEKVLKKHSINSEIFGYSSMAKFRMHNIFNFTILKKYFKDFYKYTNCNIFILFVLSVFSKTLLFVIYRKLKKSKKEVIL